MYIVHGDSSEKTREVDYSNANYDYDYPNQLQLKPGTKFHDKLASRILQRAQESRLEMSKRFDSWNEIDQVLTTYISADDKEKKVKEKDSRRPISIVFPYTYSMLEAILTYMSIAFFQDPMFQYEGMDDQDVIGAMLLEQIIKFHCFKSKVPLSLHTVLRDSFAYGIGIGVPGWVKEYGRVPVKSEVILDSDLGTTSDRSVNFITDLVFEGNTLSNIDPYMWLPDPSVSSAHIQDGEYVGWVERDNYMNLLSEERDDTNVFNVKYVKHHKDKKSTLALDQSQRTKKFNGPAESVGKTKSTHPVDTIKMYITLIPKDWELSDSEYPEKWFFALSADSVITQCYKADYNHGMYPMGVASPEFDGYSTTPIGRLEILYGLQGTLDFLFNSHIANVRKSINDMIVADPYLVNIKDLEDPRPGKIIRTRRPAWGHGVDKVVQQLVVQDITRANIQDSMYITQWMDRISGADQSMQGSLRQGGPDRLTKSEFQGTRGSAVSRLQRLAQIIGMQFMQDIGTMFAVHTQQYMSKATYVKLAGRNEQQLKQYFGKQNVEVTPWDISVAYDVLVRDGSIPGGNFSESWIQLFQTIAGNQELHSQFDVFRIFSYIAHQMGAKNIDDFKRVANNTQISTMPDDQVQNQIQQGNLVPLEGGS